MKPVNDGVVVVQVPYGVSPLVNPVKVASIMLLSIKTQVLPLNVMYLLKSWSVYILVPPDTAKS